MFGNWMKKNQQDENKISILVTEREETRKVIRKLKNRMDETVQKAAEADELLGGLQHDERPAAGGDAAF